MNAHTTLLSHKRRAINLVIFTCLFVGGAVILLGLYHNRTPVPDTVYSVRDKLLTRNVKVHWLQAKWSQLIEKSQSGLFPAPRLKPEMFSEQASDLMIDKSFEWSGAYAGSGPLLKDISTLVSLDSSLKQARIRMNSDLSSNNIQNLVTQNDYLDFYENFKVDTEGIPATDGRSRLIQEILSNIDLIIRNFHLKSSQTMPMFALPEFFSKIGISSPPVIRSLALDGNTMHEYASNFRYHDNVFIATTAKCIAVRNEAYDSAAPSSGEKGLFCLVEYRSLIDDAGKLTYTHVPKVIRLEWARGNGERWVPFKYAIYNVTDHSTQESLDFQRVAEEDGGAPFMNLPNAYNSYRTNVTVSCIQCHQGFVKFGFGKDVVLFRLDSERSNTLANYYRKTFSIFSFEENNK